MEAFMLASLDILQSIPVLSFLPGVMLAMVALFPTRQLGVEMGAILLIFTGEVWNMAFSFYSSIKSIPRELREAASIYGFSRWQRLWQLELPYSAIGLVWNSMVSVANGWFFLMACEMFVLGNRDFRLPGLGSYLQTAAGSGNVSAMAWGLFTVIAIIVAIDQLLWRPIIAWSDKFKFEQVESNTRVKSPLLQMLRQSSAVRLLQRYSLQPLSEGIYRRLALRRVQRRRRAASAVAGPVLEHVAAHFINRGRHRCRNLLRLSHSVVSARHSWRRPAAYFERRGGHLPARQRFPADRFTVDDSRRRCHWLSSAAGAHRAAPCADCSLGPGDRTLSHHPTDAHPRGRRPGHRIAYADAAGLAVVHPLQRDCGCNGHPLRPA
jgi:ABC-type proline/glycine betaine transport system permease subunit